VKPAGCRLYQSETGDFTVPRHCGLRSQRLVRDLPSSRLGKPRNKRAIAGLGRHPLPMSVRRPAGRESGDTLWRLLDLRLARHQDRQLDGLRALAPQNRCAAITTAAVGIAVVVRLAVDRLKRLTDLVGDLLFWLPCVQTVGDDDPVIVLGRERGESAETR
jgi:hypothetical protein